MKEPTKRQLEVLTFISEYHQTHAYPPTIREMADYFSISVKGAQDHIAALKKKGLLKQGDKKSRTIKLVKNDDDDEDNDVLSIPVMGTVAAGQPILAEENREGFIHLSRSLLKKNSDYFALKVMGDSMKDAGIIEGDIAVIEQQNMVQNGEIAVVLLDDAATLKTFFRENSRIRLQPANPNYSPIYCSQEIRVLGRLAHIMRSYSISAANP